MSAYGRLQNAVRKYVSERSPEELADRFCWLYQDRRSMSADRVRGFLDGSAPISDTIVLDRLAVLVGSLARVRLGTRARMLQMTGHVSSVAGVLLFITFVLQRVLGISLGMWYELASIFVLLLGYLLLRREGGR